MCGSDGLSSSSSLLICGKSCRCQAENPLNALSSFPKPALPMEIRQEGLFVLDLLQRLCALQTGHLILSRSNSNHTQGRPRHLAFPPLPDLQKIKNYATVEYSSRAWRGGLPDRFEDGGKPVFSEPRSHPLDSRAHNRSMSSSTHSSTDGYLCAPTLGSSAKGLPSCVVQTDEDGCNARNSTPPCPRR